MSYIQRYAAAPYNPTSARIGGLVELAGLAGLSLSGLSGGSGGLSSLFRVAAPLGGAYFGYTRGADFLRSTGIGQSVVGWLGNSPVGSFFGADPYRPVGGALGALAGFSLGRLFG